MDKYQPTYPNCRVDCTTDCGHCKGGWNPARAAAENDGPIRNAGDMDWTAAAPTEDEDED